MDKQQLLYSLRDMTREILGDAKYPVQPTERNPEPEPIVPNIFLQRVPSAREATKKAPYVLHQIATGEDIQKPGTMPTANALVRHVFVIYNEDEQEGGMQLLEMVEKFRIGLLQRLSLGNFRLDLTEGVDTTIYPDDTAPFYIAEMGTTWDIPAINRIAPRGHEGLQWDKPGGYEAPQSIYPYSAAKRRKE